MFYLSLWWDSKFFIQMKDCCCWLRIAITAAASQAFSSEGSGARGLPTENNVTNPKKKSIWPVRSPLSWKHNDWCLQSDSKQLRNAETSDSNTSNNAAQHKKSDLIWNIICCFFVFKCIYNLLYLKLLLVPFRSVTLFISSS